MTPLNQQIDDFAAFARSHSGGEVTLDDLYYLWRSNHRRDNDAAAVKASLRDMQGGDTGRPFEEFASEFRERNNLNGE